MCITHLIHYRQCNHSIPDLRAIVNDRCDAVSAALVFYHDQPSWKPLNEPLILPRTCPPVKLRGGHVSQVILQEQAAWDQWMIGQFVSNGFGWAQRREFMHRALGAIMAPPPNIWALYPANQERQYYALIEYQNRPHKAPNVVFTTVDGGCGRGTKSACHGQGRLQRLLLLSFLRLLLLDLRPMQIKTTSRFASRAAACPGLTTAQ